MAVVAGDEDFVDQIYEAAIVPELWPGVLDHLTRIGGGFGTCLLTADANNLRWTATNALRPVFEDWLAQGWHLRNTRMPRLLALRHAGFIREVDVFTEAELAANPEVTDFFNRKYGLGRAGGTAIPMASGELLVISIEREFAKGPIGRQAIAQLDALRPHLARAGLLSGRLLLERARAIASALDTIGLPAAVLRDPGGVLAVNRQFSMLVPRVFQDRKDRLRAVDARADLLLGTALSEIGMTGAGVRSIPIAASDGQSPFIVHVIPVRGLARDIFSQGVAVVVAMPVDRAAVPSAELLQGLFDLTPAEARVARGIGEGGTIESLAAELGLSRETVRSQLRAVFAKVGVTRQADLVALLSGLALPRG
jgi:DNA-binding CsgD family transcriptional regulator